MRIDLNQNEVNVLANILRHVLAEAQNGLAELEEDECAFNFLERAKRCLFIETVQGVFEQIEEIEEV